MLQYPDNPYLLLTPGPLSTTKTVKAAMLRDWCTWDTDYNNLVKEIRSRIVNMATQTSSEYTCTLMQGSGTFSVESVIGSVIPNDGKLLILINGAYGERMLQIAGYLQIENSVLRFSETEPVNAELTEKTLAENPDITHVAVVHCETTTGMLNPVSDIGEVVKKHQKIFIVDAMSSFGGFPFDISAWNIDFLVSSANKCIQGVPGFGFVVARRVLMEKLKGRARSLSLDLYDQWNTMEQGDGKWRFTSPTHVVRAFLQALNELDEEGGPVARYQRYQANQILLVNGLRELGLMPLLPDQFHSPFITTFLFPGDYNFSFQEFYDALKQKGFVIYPGKVTHYECFRIGTIGDVHIPDIERLILTIKSFMTK
ncbi:MAG: 2-aminoethylphosphonate-pyruvate transaminase [Anaerophaga sp.]|uniref:2-aminoethylphosphonate--pyruvate transaminase n=1 Tax=Anaerophaga thermohalophila TaxID=177400 RepID=UPI000237CFB5|nr:2-aminoethylphosphonate--pyruvate transaminase [Anaerophaga thermohalophila]MDK2840726.1 2-aminoethylphosphonate-pyruvate transaminase [Anaerophaga sp.]MDN5291134.1 2-aminoethylphosphonate-pyruvate transaminase [Anaerophaga sp.]